MKRKIGFILLNIVSFIEGRLHKVVYWLQNLADKIVYKFDV